MLSEILAKTDIVIEREPRGTRHAARAPSNAEKPAVAFAADAGPRNLEQPVLLETSGAKIVCDIYGQVSGLTSGAVELATRTHCLTIVEGRLCGRTRYSDAALQLFLSRAATEEGPVEALLALSATESPDLFLHAERTMVAGSAILSVTTRDLNRHFENFPNFSRLYGLTASEEQIIWRMLDGLSVAQIAIELRKSVLTVRTHVKRAYVKLGVRTKEQLFANALKLMVD